jgi:hypothetical protein
MGVFFFTLPGASLISLNGDLDEFDPGPSFE